MPSFFAARVSRLHDWIRIRRLYARAFPPSERKPFSMILSMRRKGKTDVWCFYQDGRFAGFASTINGDGLILIDTGYQETAEVVIESVTELGFDVRDIRYILHSHGHGDHTDGTPRMVEVSGAETFLAQADVKYLNGWVPDHYYNDGQIISLGNTQILCLATPGHTEGTYSFFFHVEVDGKTYRAGMFGGAGTNQLKKDFLNTLIFENIVTFVICMRIENGGYK